MAKNKPSSSVEITSVAPTLRHDLRFSLQQHGGKACYLIEDEKNSKFYRIGIPEYTFISLLDGTTSIRDAMAYTAAQLGTDAFTEHHAASICKWLIDSQLAHTSASSEYERLLHGSQQIERSRTLQKVNPLFIRLPLTRPDRMLSTMTQWLGWWFSWPAFVAWLACLGYASFQLMSNWDRVAGSRPQIFAAGNYWRLLAIWIALKVIHELSHGVACKKFGGHVRETGLMLIALAPVPYVDVTAAWRFASKWQRIVVSAAGMYTELFVAAVAAVVWVRADSLIWQQQAYNVFITASLITLFFNANPLMRFDGYYILSDFIEIPNLYGLGQQYLRHVGRRIYLGVPSQLPNWTPRRGVAIRVYAVLALVWRVLVGIGLIVVASTLLAGAGIVLAIIAAALWLAVPLVRFVPYLLFGSGTEKPNQQRFCIAAATTLAAGVAICWLPEPGGVRAPAVVTYRPLHVVRAPFNGFVRQVFIQAGSQVQCGDVILVVENMELSTDAADMKLEREQVAHRSRAYQKDGDLAAMQVEQEIADVLSTKIVERTAQLADATLVAPADGVVITRNVASLVGRFVREGEELLAVGTDTRKQLEVSVAQLDVQRFINRLGQTVDVIPKSPGVPCFQSQLRHVEPSAARRLHHPALAASHGGPLPVQPMRGEDKQETLELVEPHFTADVILDKDISQRLRAGQLATVRLKTARGTLAGWARRSLGQWLESKLSRNDAGKS